MPPTKKRLSEVVSPDSITRIQPQRRKKSEHKFIGKKLLGTPKSTGNTTENNFNKTRPTVKPSILRSSLKDTTEITVSPVMNINPKVVLTPLPLELIEKHSKPKTAASPMKELPIALSPKRKRTKLSPYSPPTSPERSARKRRIELGTEDRVGVASINASYDKEKVLTPRTASLQPTRTPKPQRGRKSKANSSVKLKPAESPVKLNYRLKRCGIELMNITTQRRVGVAVKMMLSRLDIDDGLHLPLAGLDDSDFDRRPEVESSSIDIEIGDIFSQRPEDSEMYNMTNYDVSHGMEEEDYHQDPDYSPHETDYPEEPDQINTDEEEEFENAVRELVEDFTYPEKRKGKKSASNNTKKSNIRVKPVSSLMTAPSESVWEVDIVSREMESPHLSSPVITEEQGENQEDGVVVIPSTPPRFASMIKGKGSITKVHSPIKLTEDVTIHRSSRKVMFNPPVVLESEDSLQVKNTKMLFPFESFENLLTDNVDLLLEELTRSEVEVPRKRRKAKVVFEKLESPDYNLPVEDWLKALLWKYVNAELIARETTKLFREEDSRPKLSCSPTKMRNLTLLKMVRDKTASSIGPIVSVSVSSQDVSLKLKNGATLFGRPVGSTRWFNIPLIGKNWYYDLNRNKIVDSLPTEMEEYYQQVQRKETGGSAISVYSSLSPSKRSAPISSGSSKGVPMKTLDGKTIYVKGLVNVPSKIADSTDDDDDDDDVDDPASVDDLDDEENDTSPGLVDDVEEDMSVPVTTPGSQTKSRTLLEKIGTAKSILQEQNSLLCSTKKCMSVIPKDQFGEHCNTVHAKLQLNEISFYDEDLVKRNISFFPHAFVCSGMNCRHLFISFKRIKRSTVNRHWDESHQYGKPRNFGLKLKTLTSAASGGPKDAASTGRSRRRNDALRAAIAESIDSLPEKAPKLTQEESRQLQEAFEETVIPAAKAKPAARKEDVPPNVPQAVNMKSSYMGPQLNQQMLSEILEFFNIYMDDQTRLRLKEEMSLSAKNGQAINYKQRRVKVKSDGLPSRDSENKVISQEYCTQMYYQDLLTALGEEFGQLEVVNVLVAQQYTYVNQETLQEKVYVLVPLNQRDLQFSVKTYKSPKTQVDKRMCSVVVRNQSLPSPGYDVPGTSPTMSQHVNIRELRIISQCLSRTPARDVKPQFNEHGLIKSQNYCCATTYTEVMNQWWDMFIKRIPGKREASGEESFDSSLVESLPRKICINGTLATPKKKEVIRNYDNSQSLHMTFTFFSTDEAILNLTLIRVQWVKDSRPVNADDIFLPPMNDFDTLVEYLRLGHVDMHNKVHKSCFKSTEISFLDTVKVLVNKNCVPRNQAIFVVLPKNQTIGDLKSFLGTFKRYAEKPVQLFIGSCKYEGTASLYRRRFGDMMYDLLVMITLYKFSKNYGETEVPENFPQTFTQAEISWVDRPKYGKVQMVDDELVETFPDVKRQRKEIRIRHQKELLDLMSKIGYRVSSYRLKILNKYSPVTLRPDRDHVSKIMKTGAPMKRGRKKKSVPGRKMQGGEDRSNLQNKASGEPSQDGGGGGDSAAKENDSEVELGAEEDVCSNTTTKYLMDELVNFDSYARIPQPVTYNKREDSGHGLLMVRSSKALTHALVGGSTAVNAGWNPSPIELEIYEPRLTNASMILTGFTVPNIIHKVRKTPKLCLGPVALSSFKSNNDANLLGEHLKYNNDNVTRVNAIAACNDELFHALRTGLKAFNCIYTYDESTVLNSATNRVKCLKNGIKESEINLSSEIGALRVTWEVYMNKIVGLKQEADLADLFLSLDGNEEYILIDPEGIRLFRLNALEKSQLDEDELRRYEMEFFEWLGMGTYPDIPWKEYVIKKISADPTLMVKSMTEDEYIKWNQDQSFDNQFFGNMILQEGTLPKIPKHGRKKKMLKSKVTDSPTRGRGARIMELEDFNVEENQDVFSAFNRVVVDGTFMI